MTAEKSSISDQHIHEQKEPLAQGQDGPDLNQELPEEAVDILESLHNRPDNMVMTSEALRLVSILWPSAFNVSDPRPLKIGIHKDMAEANLLPDHVIPVALQFFTSMERYLEKIKPGATRINLLGKAAGRVRLREAVDAEIKLYTRSSDFNTIRHQVIIKKIRLLSVKKRA